MTLKIRAGITALGVYAGEEVEIEDTPSVRNLLKHRLWTELRLKDGAGSDLPE